jgi:DNA-binding MarR family transcriptional regulator
LTVDYLDHRDISGRPRRCQVTADADRQEIPLLLRRLNVELDAVGQRFADRQGLNRTDVRALVAIMDAARRGEALTAGGLGDAVDLRSASVTALVDRLERAGHVRRVRDPDDRRRVALEISDSAMAAGAEHFGGLQRDLLAAMAGYSDEELSVVRRFLEDMTRVIERHARPPDPQR